MKFYCIIPATKDKEGVCVLPTMQEPEILNLEQRLLLSTIEQIRYEDSHKLFRKHIKVDLPKFPTSCDRVGWFEATEKHEGFSYSFSHEMGERAKWEVITKEEYEKARPTYRRKFIVPQSEEKDEPKTYTESEVREIVGRTWEAAVERNEDEMASEALGFETKHPDKETFINGLLK
jgi:hypothetical protein